MSQKNYEIEWQTVSIRSIRIFFLIVAAIFTTFAYFYWIRPQSQKTPPPVATADNVVARFVDYEGRVEVKAREKFQWTGANFKLDLHEQDRIRTHENSSARVRFSDGTEITVQPKSIVVIRKRNASQQSTLTPLMEIETGRGDINAEKSTSAPSVRTPKINRVTFSQGGGGSVEVNQRTGENIAAVRKGEAELDFGNRKMLLVQQEKVKVGEGTYSKVSMPGIPRVYEPQNGQIFTFPRTGNLSVELRWRDVPRIRSYHVQMSEHALFAKLLNENPNLTGNSLMVHVPPGGKKQYYWRVRSINYQNVAGEWSSTNVFVVQPPRAVTKNPKAGPPVIITLMHPFLPYLQIDGKTAIDTFLTLNGEVIDVKKDGSFIYTYTLRKAGVNDLVFVAEDAEGNTTTLTKQFTYE